MQILAWACTSDMARQNATQITTITQAEKNTVKMSPATPGLLQLHCFRHRKIHKLHEKTKQSFFPGHMLHVGPTGVSS